MSRDLSELLRPTATDCRPLPRCAQIGSLQADVASFCIQHRYISVCGELIMMHAASRCTIFIISYVGYIAFALHIEILVQRSLGRWLPMRRGFYFCMYDTQSSNTRPRDQVR